MFFKISLLIIIILVILFIFHRKKYYYQNPNLNIQQLEYYNHNDAEKIIKAKDIMIVRNFKKLNKLINYKNIVENKHSIKFNNHEKLTISKLIKDNKSFLLYQFDIKNPKIEKKIKVLKQLGSDLSLQKYMYMSYGKRNDITSIINLKFNRNYFHIIKGDIKIHLFNPMYSRRLYLKTTNDNSISISDINVSNPNMKKHKKYKKAIPHKITMILREGNLLYIPNNWSYYIEYNMDSIILNYSFHTIVSKLLSYS